MDIRTGKTYETVQAALNAGVPASSIAEIEPVDKNLSEVRVVSGPFKGRIYRRNAAGQLVRVKVKRR